MRFLSPARVIITASLVCALAPVPAFSAPSRRDMRTALVALYPLTRVGMSGLVDFDYTRVTEPGPILAVRIPGIYADVANTKNAILETNYSDGKLTQQTGLPPPSAATPAIHARLPRMRRSMSCKLP
jgi:hypothetical protein